MCYISEIKVESHRFLGHCAIIQQVIPNKTKKNLQK